jgi:hypothetical protein
MEVKLNILDIKVEGVKENDDIIQLTDKVSIKLRYPEFSFLKKVSKLQDISDIAFEMIADCIEYVYDGEQFYYAKEISSKEMVEFVESLNQAQFSKIEDFFANLPRLEKKIDMKCSRCGFEHRLDVEGLENFFG